MDFEVGRNFKLGCRNCALNRHGDPMLLYMGTNGDLQSLETNSQFVPENQWLVQMCHFLFVGGPFAYFQGVLPIFRGFCIFSGFLPTFRGFCTSFCNFSGYLNCLFGTTGLLDAVCAFPSEMALGPPDRISQIFSLYLTKVDYVDGPIM